MKKILVTICLIALICTLASCDCIKEDDAKVFVQEYLNLLEEENYDAMESVSYFSEDDVVLAFENLENESNLDFQTGIEVIAYTDFQSYYSDSYYGMPICHLSMQVDIDGTGALMEMNVVDNDGVYNVCDVYITINNELFGIS